MAETDAMILMIQNRQTVLDTYTEAGRNVTKTHEILKSRLPELHISLSQFKPYIKAMVLTFECMNEEIALLRQEKARSESEIETLRNAIRHEKEFADSEIRQLNAELSERPVSEKGKVAGKNIEGWNIVFSGGYCRLFRKVSGRMQAIYLGKKFDSEKAMAKIREKEKLLGIVV